MSNNIENVAMANDDNRVMVVDESGQINESEFSKFVAKISEFICEITGEFEAPKINGILLMNGQICINAANDFSKKWIKDKTNIIGELWPGAKLKICSFEKIMLTIPISKNETHLETVKRQNEEINLSNWRLIQRIEIGDKIQLTYNVDTSSIEFIHQHGDFVFYGLSQIKVIFPSKFSNIEHVDTNSDEPTMKTSNDQKRKFITTIKINKFIFIN